MTDLTSIDYKDIYVTDEAAEAQPARYASAVKSFLEIFGGTEEDIRIFSAPGRSEIGGNHTDHQNGQVLAASVNRDAIAVARKTCGNLIRVHAEGFDPVEILTDDLAAREEERGSTAALVRGVLYSLCSGRNYELEGFDAYITSDVLIGAGLSSSAAFETLIGTIVSGLYNGMKIDPVTIAMAGQEAENEFFGKPCGLMDQMASSVGGMVFIDFKDPNAPVVRQVGFDLDEVGYALCITDTKGSHADLTSDYAAIPEEMTKIAKLLGQDKLRGITINDIIGNMDTLRAEAGDRAVLRAIHFTQENERAALEADALERGDISSFIALVRKSGDSSYKYLQNVYSDSKPKIQNVSLALAISDLILEDNEAARVHGGGFAGTIQAFVRKENKNRYKELMDKVFGQGSCEIMSIRRYGGIESTPEGIRVCPAK